MSTVSTISGFEKRITDEQIAAARQKIADGSTLRAAAAAIPCAPSTLSYRIKKVVEADAAASATGDHTSPKEADDSDAARVGPLEVLRQALQATKAGGQPDWATRIAAARAIAALRPQELEATPPKEIPAEIVIFDLDPGAHQVIHRARAAESEVSGADERAESSDAGPQGERDPSDPYVFMYRQPDEPGGGTIIALWHPGRPDRPADPNAVANLRLVTTDDLATAELWRAQLNAGRLPPRVDTADPNDE